MPKILPSQQRLHPDGQRFRDRERLGSDEYDRRQLAYRRRAELRRKRAREDTVSIEESLARIRDDHRKREKNQPHVAD